MNIDKSKLKIGLWYEDEEGNVIPCEDWETPKGAVTAHVCWPLEVQTNVYHIDKDGSYGTKDRMFTSNVNLCRDSGRLAVAMVNSGDYDLYEALGVLANACERCMNVLWNRYLPKEDGYPEYSKEWCKANTVCEFCKDMPQREEVGNNAG